MQINFEIKATEIEYMPYSTVYNTTSNGGQPVYDNIAKYLDQNVETRNLEIDDRLNELVRRLDRLEEQMNQEKEIRENNEFVNDLYMQYQSALKLVTDSDNIK